MSACPGALGTALGQGRGPRGASGTARPQRNRLVDEPLVILVENRDNDGALRVRSSVKWTVSTGVTPG